MAEAEPRGLVRADGAGIHTFSNGSEWEGWADGNCLSCQHYELDGNAGEFCAFEGASMLHMVSPELAELFGWTQDPKYRDYRAAWDKGEQCHGWNAPQTCAFFAQRSDDDGDSTPRPTPHDPAQLTLLADPTEDIALATRPARTEVLTA